MIVSVIVMVVAMQGGIVLVSKEKEKGKGKKITGDQGNCAAWA
jgi:hypothetical protein